jgi:3-hydroxyacyl-[acyl-carrier-protein] dehydratase
MSEAAAVEELGSADILRIMELIPHRYPFLMIDKVVDMVHSEQATGIKNVTINEPFFQGHFPGHPVMPGMLIVEAMAQTAGALVVASLGPEAEGRLVYFMTVDNCRFRKPVGPGDQLRVHVMRKHRRGNVWKFHSDVTVDGRVVAEADFAAMIMDRESAP